MKFLGATDGWAGLDPALVKGIVLVFFLGFFLLMALRVLTTKREVTDAQASIPLTDDVVEPRKGADASPHRS